ncbi:MAG: AI-2E family transporter [Gemmatimonadota bacterium]|nr:AI-2E family transporter [Gemmatimonadota bacterium]
MTERNVPDDGAVPPRKITISTRDVVRIIALTIAAFLLLRLVWAAHPVFFLLFLGVLFGLPLSSAADRFEKRGVRRGISVALILVVFIGLLTGGGIFMAPILRSQSTELKQRLPEAMDKFDTWLGVHANGLAALLLTPGEATDSARIALADSSRGEFAEEPEPVVVTNSATVSTTSSSLRVDSAAHAQVVVKGSNLRREITHQMTSAQHSFLGVLRSTFALGGGLLLVLFVAAYIGADPELYRGLMLELVPSEKRPHAALTLQRVGDTLRAWLTMQLIAMVVIGGVTTIFLFAIHVKAALPLGILAGLLKFIPIVGSIFAAIPAVAMGFIDSPHKALVILVGYVIIQLVENHLLVPVLMKAGVDIPPALTLGIQALMSVLFGFLGLLLAVPVLAVIMTIFRTINASEMRALSRDVAPTEEIAQ